MFVVLLFCATEDATDNGRQIIASRPRGIRRTNPRRNSGKAQVLGTTTTAPATRARAVPASNGAKVVAPATTQQQPADKIIVSNLPTDVNEAQVKVRTTQSLWSEPIFDSSLRSSSIRRLVRSRMLRFTTIVKVGRRELRPCTSNDGETATRRSRHTTTG